MSARAHFLAMLLRLAIFGASAAEESPKSQKPCTLFMAGDSTMAAQALIPATPARGWGQMLQPWFDETVRVENLASSGQSSKSFREKGRWQQILDRLQPGDLVIIQFGHNDHKPDAGRHTEPFGTFKENLERCVREAREHQASPILATSIVRNIFNADGKTLRDTHGDYVVATRQVAAEQKVPLLVSPRGPASCSWRWGPSARRDFSTTSSPASLRNIPRVSGTART